MLLECVYENEARNDGFCCVCGVDEAGRGPLAGPVYAAAVVLPEGCSIEGLDDSKKLTEKKREALYDIIKNTAVSCAVGIATVEEIDTVNILNATFLAMTRAIEGLDVSPDCALIDGNRAPKINIECRTIVKGDAKCPSIAAASVLAKVSRDRYMREMAEKYPQYQFEKHKGYGTKLHYEMIEKYGICPIHRKTFLKKILHND